MTGIRVLDDAKPVNNDSSRAMKGLTPRGTVPGPISFHCRRRLLSPICGVLSPCRDESASGDASYILHLHKLIGPGDRPILLANLLCWGHNLRCWPLTADPVPLLMPDFLFVTCQIGAEQAVKGELARRWPGFRFAFSRPGFLTFKLPDEHGLADDFDLESVFARAYGFSLGSVTGQTSEELAGGSLGKLPGTHGPENSRLGEGSGRAGRTQLRAIHHGRRYRGASVDRRTLSASRQPAAECRRSASSRPSG